jgi:hypothetical protein
VRLTLDPASVLLGVVAGALLAAGAQVAVGGTVGASECARAVARYERAQRASSQQATQHPGTPAPPAVRDEVTAAALAMRRLCPEAP